MSYYCIFNSIYSMSKDKIVYYRGLDDSLVVSINYTKLVYIKYNKDREERFPMGSEKDRTEAYFLYIGYTKTTKQKFEELLKQIKGNQDEQ